MTDYLDNSTKKIKLALQLVSGYASEFQSWRLPESHEKAYTDIDFYVEMAKTAEQGKIHTLFIADTPSFGGAGGGTDIATRSPAFPLEPMVILSAVATHTKKIGLVATYSTTYNLGRALSVWVERLRERERETLFGERQAVFLFCG